MIKKSDWKTVEMPESVERFSIEISLSEEEMGYLREGHKPQEMEDKWFMYYEGEKLFLHRSWTGFCIYIVDLSERGRLHVTVNRDPEQYKEKDVEADRAMVMILLNSLIKRNGENAALMKKYLERRARASDGTKQG